MTTLTAEEAIAQVAAAHDKLMNNLPAGIQADQDARVAAANASHTVRTNAQLATGLNKTAVALPNINADVYTGGNIVTVAPNRAGVDMSPEDAQGVEDLEQEVVVENALQEDDLFARGGPISEVVGYYSDYTSLSDYVDPMFLVEASKQTGEKFF